MKMIDVAFFPFYVVFVFFAAIVLSAILAIAIYLRVAVGLIELLPEGIASFFRKRNRI